MSQVRVLHGPQGARYFPRACFMCRWCGVCYGVGACCRLAREPVGALLCSHSSQSSSGTGWVYSARGGILVDTPDLGSGVLRGVWVRVPPGALVGFSGLALRKLNTLMCPWWNFGRHARFRLWCPLRRVGSSPTGRTGGKGVFLHLPLAARVPLVL